MPAKQLVEFLDGHNVKYITITHSTAYTAQEIAAMVHIRGRELAKTVIVKLDNDVRRAKAAEARLRDTDAAATVRQERPLQRGDGFGCGGVDLNHRPLGMSLIHGSPLFILFLISQGHNPTCWALIRPVLGWFLHEAVAVLAQPSTALSQE